MELGVKNDDVLCLTIGRLATVKGHDILLGAIEHLRTCPEWTSCTSFGLAADTWRPIFARKLPISANGRIHILGHQANPIDWLDASDVFILPSHVEGMPISIMEAMAKGLPVMASAVSGIPEELGGTGQLLASPVVDPAATASDIAKTLRQWASDTALRHAIGEAGKARPN